MAHRCAKEKKTSTKERDILYEDVCQILSNYHFDETPMISEGIEISDQNNHDDVDIDYDY